MVRAIRFTNLDDYCNVEWPPFFAFVPQKGEKIEGQLDNRRPVLRVIGITHGWDHRAGEPKITVELHN